MSRRLISKASVASHEARLRAAADDALDVVLATARSRVALTAAGSKKVAGAALAGTALYGLWSQSQWTKALGVYVDPTLLAIEREMTSEATAAMGGAAVWGFAPSGDMTSAIMIAAADAGSYFGERLDAAGLATDPMAAVGGVLDTASDIIAAGVAAMAQALANSLSNELSQYVVTGNPINYSDATHTWNSMDDERTREWHADASGQEQPVGTPFDVDGEDMMYPGDPAGSDSNTVNCRCWEEVSGSAMEQPSAIEDYTGTPAYASPAGGG